MTGAGTIAGLSGCVSGGSGGGGGGGGGKITVGHIAPLQADIGKGSLRGTQIAVDEINNSGGILGKKLELVKGDTQLKPSQASSIVNNMLHQKNVDLLTGTFVSEVMLGIEDAVANAHVPYIDTGAASPKISQNHMGKDYEKYKNIFRVSPVNSDFQAKALADYGKYLSDQHGWNSFAVVVEDAAWTKSISDKTPKQLKQHGLEVTLTDRFAPDTSDFTPILDKVKSSGAEVMLKAIAHVPGTSLLSTWRQNKYPFAQEGINVSSMSPHYWKDTNGGCLFETTSGPAGVAEITDKTKPFIKKYKKKYSDRPELPMYMGIGSYDALYVYKNAVKAAGTSDYKNDLDKIVSKLSSTDMKGAGGHISFFPKGHKYANDVKYGVDKEPFVVDQWQKATNGDGLAGTNGTKEAVWPKKYATAKHVAPPWMS